MKVAVCKNCGREGHYKTFCPVLKRPPIKVNKGVRKVGRRGLLYAQWRDEVAIPHLTAKNGLKCVVCGSQSKLDVAHLLGRGSHPHLKMELSNVVLKCRNCHIIEHNGTNN